MSTCVVAKTSFYQVVLTRLFLKECVLQHAPLSPHQTRLVRLLLANATVDADYSVREQ